MKKFKKMKKLAAAVVLTGMVGAAGAGAAYAASHLPGCNSQLKKVICDSYKRAEMAGRHFLYKTANGTEVYCSKTAATANHEIRCYNSQCNALLGTSYRTCEIGHQYCPTETGVCQY